MVHTASLTYTHYSPQLYKDCLIGTTGLKQLVQSGNFITTDFEDIGFKHIIFYKKRKKFDSGATRYEYTTFIRIDFLKLCGYGLINELRATDLLETISNNFNKYIDNINPNLPKLHEWKVKRIDYSIDLNVKYPELYIELFQKGRSLSRSYKKPMDKKAKRRKYLPGSVYLKAKSKTVNFYNKYAQLESCNMLPADEEEQEKLKHILRLEIQITNTNYFQQNQHISINQLRYFLDPLLAIETIKKDFLKIVANKGDYYILSEAKNKVENSNYSKEKKKRLTEFLDNVAKVRSMANYRKKYPNNKNTKALVRMLENLGINPVCITQKQQRKYHVKHIKHIPSLYERITVDIDKRFIKLELTKKEEREQELQNLCKILDITQ